MSHGLKYNSNIILPILGCKLSNSCSHGTGTLQETHRRFWLLCVEHVCPVCLPLYYSGQVPDGRNSFAKFCAYIHNLVDYSLQLTITSHYLASCFGILHGERTSLIFKDRFLFNFHHHTPIILSERRVYLSTIITLHSTCDHFIVRVEPNWKEIGQVQNY